MQSVIESLLRQKIGLEASSIGSGSIARAIHRRMGDCRILDMVEYLRLLQESTQEWEALIESVIVPETWFFREREAFFCLKHYVTSEWLPTHSNRVLRILSVPCSTGEEPYSIAIALLETGLSVINVQIDAVDISKNSLLTAQTAIYNKYSFRDNTLSFLEQYFQFTEAGHRLCQYVKSMVNFMHGNLADPNFLASTPPYDIVFCRNLLIYFDRATKERTIKVFERLLTQKGLLFVGHAEAGLLLNTEFVPVRYPRAFVYRKSVTSYPLLKSIHSKTVAKKHHPTDKTLSQNSISQTQEFIVQIDNLNPSKEPEVNLLETAKTLADRGCLDEATQLCNEHLNQNPASAEAYFLLGQLQQAMGQNEQATQFFQKAIYLQPTHQEALTHLALLREHQGDVSSATLLWQRIYRLQK